MRSTLGELIQCVIAHVDMPLESGPTKLLPFSQQYEQGYSQWRDEAFSAYFEESYIQYPLQKGDVVFLNPALFHAAGDNRSKDIKRIANLMQIVSCMSKPLEAGVMYKNRLHSLYAPMTHTYI